MVIFPLAPDQTIAQMWSSGARGRDHRLSDTRSIAADEMYSTVGLCVEWATDHLGEVLV